MEKITFKQINTGIINGEFDAELGQISQSIKIRKEMLDVQLKNSLNVGDKVRFNKSTKPVYMRGMLATVTQIRRERVSVKLDNPTGRFQSEIVTPVSLLEKV
jgi:preprotein translocase subunit YajC